MRKVRRDEHLWGAEPWEVREVTGGTLSRRVKDLCVFDADGKMITSLECVKLSAQFSPRALANAERIIASVNWCRQ